MPTDEKSKTVAVWDPVVRYGHWALVVAFAVTYLSSEEETGFPDPIHVWGGYVIGAIVLFRVFWGFAGSRHARFRDFAYGPTAAMRYLSNLVFDRARRYIGHSPAGGMMVFLLLISLAGTVGTGVLAYGQQGHGPLASLVTTTTLQPRQGADDDADEAQAGQPGEREEGAVAEVHAALANITLGLIVLHILGVLLASARHRENLIAAMIFGQKRAGD
ncbi:MAG: cytochrome b/b6 domain-containing protein [Pseudomonadota bacterium]|nr:cytochrome b/b6 domain-containing protein [Pseudomonadota bacterium]